MAKHKLVPFAAHLSALLSPPPPVHLKSYIRRDLHGWSPQVPASVLAQDEQEEVTLAQDGM